MFQIMVDLLWQCATSAIFRQVKEIKGGNRNKGVYTQADCILVVTTRVEHESM